MAPSSSGRFPIQRLNLNYLQVLLAVVAIYFVAGKLGLYFATFNPSSSPVWPPAGIALTALLLGGVSNLAGDFRRRLPANITTSGAVFASLGIASGNTLEAVVGAYLTVHCANGLKMFDRAGDFFKYVAISALAASISSTVGLSSLALAGAASSNDFTRIWLTWWLGDVGGYLLVAPFLILWIVNPAMIRDPRRSLEASFTLMAIAVVGVLVFGGALPGVGHYPLGFVSIPILVWSAFRFGQREAATAIMVLVASATWGIKQGLGPWARFANPVGSLILPQAFMITMAVMTLAMAAVVWERKNAEAEANQARQQAENANRAKDQFLAMLGHELRNPLGALASAVRVLEIGNVPPEQAMRLRQIMARQSGHLTRLVDDLLDVGRVTAGTITLKRQPMNLGEYARECVATLCLNPEYAERDISLQTDPVWIEGDRDRVEQILSNLLSNSVKHTSQDGKIILAVRREGDQAVVRVEDDGDGMSPDLLPQVFDLFVQAEQRSDRRGGGLGIGLTLVRRLVELHGGMVEAHSDGIGRGSVFIVTMPCVEVRPEDLKRQAAPVRPEVSRRILIVEDNSDARIALRLMLERMGHQVFEADSGPSGVQSALANRPDVALVDIGLPEYDGYEVATRIRSAPNADGIILIALTGYGMPEDGRKAEQAGFDAHLVKPLDLGALAELLAARA